MEKTASSNAAARSAHGRRIAVVGLGYVGLPVAAAFAQSGAWTLGFDIDKTRVRELREGYDRTNELDTATLTASELRVSSEASDLAEADFYIVTVPTPIDAAKRPDLGALVAASRTVGKVLKRGDIVVYESTVFPGATEENCCPVLEAASGLRSGTDFTLGYSPERINPGDKVHRFETIKKVVSGQDAPTLDVVADVYGSVVKAGVHRAASIKVAEAAKVIENTQRDLNIALMNELSLIFGRLGIDTADVLAAAGTKWNFLPFTPGLVGGHCIGVDPYYLTHKAEMVSYHPQVILAGRRINDGMAEEIALACTRRLGQRGVGAGRVGILGLTFKENVPDLRNSKVADIVTALRRFGLDVLVTDPYADAADARHEYGIDLAPLDALTGLDAVVLAVPHRAYVEKGWSIVRSCLKDGTGVVLDVRSCLDRASTPDGVDLWRL